MATLNASCKDWINKPEFMSRRVFCAQLARLSAFSLLSSPGLVTAATNSTIPVYLREERDAQGRLLLTHLNTQRLFDFLSQQTGLQFELRSLPWARAQWMARNGHGLIWAFSKSQQRLADYDYSQTLLVAPIWGVAYKEPRLRIRDVEDLRGKVVSVERGVSHGLEFEAARGKIFQTDEDVASEASRFKKLVAGRSDVLLWGSRRFYSADELERYLNKEFIPGLHDPDLQYKYFYVSSQALFIDTLHIACARGKWREVMQRLDQAISLGLKSGELTRILKDLG